MQHLLAINDLTAADIQALFKRADNLQKMTVSERRQRQLGKTALCLFYENSTRTLMSFQLAAQNLGMQASALTMAYSSTQKGETFDDTIKTLAAMAPDTLIMRHPENHIHQHVKSFLPKGIHLINAGDGQNQHPSQALLDLYTISQHKNNIEQLKVTVIGDIKHSRVANSLIDGLSLLGNNNIHLYGPANLIPKVHTGKTAENLKQALTDSDVVVMLRIQKERFASDESLDISTWYAQYGLDSEKLKWAKADAIVLHPGPMNRGIEIASEVADGPQSVILEQVKNGVLIRQAILDHLLS